MAVTAAVDYQSFEAVVADKFLGNMVDDNGNFVLEPCVLGGLCRQGASPTPARPSSRVRRRSR